MKKMRILLALFIPIILGNCSAENSEQSKLITNKEDYIVTDPEIIKNLDSDKWLFTEGLNLSNQKKYAISKNTPIPSSWTYQKIPNLPIEIPLPIGVKIENSTTLSGSVITCKIGACIGIENMKFSFEIIPMIVVNNEEEYFISRCNPNWKINGKSKNIIIRTLYEIKKGNWKLIRYSTNCDEYYPFTTNQVGFVLVNNHKIYQIISIFEKFDDHINGENFAELSLLNFRPISE